MIFGTIAFALIVRTATDSKPTETPGPESPFIYSFHVDGTLNEADDYQASGSPYWWLDSGGRLIIEDGVGKTIQGRLNTTDRWRVRYARTSADDTDNGYQPQNLFRLLTKREWENASVEARFRVVRDNETESSNRNESNGLLLMSRYKDGDNLYYAGVRVDGHAVIKKKLNGSYITLAEKQIFPGEYDGENNLLPRAWLALKSETRTVGDAVELRLYMKKESETEWTELVSVRDTSNPILGTGHSGIRTDFMDVEFDDFRAETI
jgi:hypothetical protein